MRSRTIRDIIKDREIFAVPVSTPVSHAAQLMKIRKVGAVMVVADDKLVGIFTERDALNRIVAEERVPSTTVVGDVMTRDPKFLNPDQPFSAALSMMYAGKFRHVPIVDDGKPIGIISARDALGPEFEDFIYSTLLNEQGSDVLA